MNKGLEEVQPHLAGTNIHNKGTVILGTVEGDMHDIGKNLSPHEVNKLPSRSKIVTG